MDAGYVRINQPKYAMSWPRRINYWFVPLTHASFQTVSIVTKQLYLERFVSQSGYADCNSIDNAMILCAQCHTKFEDPGWVFYPADLEYFVAYEKNDYEHRVAEASRGIQRNRSCPTATEYAIAQQQSGHISTSTVGGLYRRVFLRRLHPHIPPGDLAQEKPWFGAPIAALRRAIHATGSFRITAFLSDDFSRLRTLQDLYARPDPGPSSVISPPFPRMAVPRVDTRDDRPPSKKGCLPSDNLAEDDTSEIRSDQINESHSKAVSYWILGPQMSTEEIVSRYASVS